MNVASLELCKELYELSDWDGTHLNWANYRGNEWRISHGNHAAAGSIPAYDLSFLICKSRATV